MAENIAQTVQKVIQDILAPDVRELKVKLSSLEKQIDVRFEAMDQKTDARFDAVDVRFNAVDARFDAVDVRFNAVDARFDAMEQKMDAQFKAIMAVFGELRAQTELSSFRVIASLSERVAVLEARDQESRRH